MRRGLGQQLRLGVSNTAVSLVRTSRWHGPPLTVLAEQALATPLVDDIDTFVLIVNEVLKTDTFMGWPLTIVLADDLLRIWQLSLPAGMTRLADIEAAAAMRFHALYGEALDGWRMAAHWDSRAPWCAALPALLLTALHQAGEAHKLTIVAIEPQCVACWNRWHRHLQADDWFALLHDKVLTLVARQRGRLRALRSCLVPPDADRAWLARLLAREALLLELDCPRQLQMCGQASPWWVEGDDDEGAIRCRQLDGRQQAMHANLSPAALLAGSGRWR